MPVASLLKFLFDDIADQKDLASAKEIRDDERLSEMVQKPS